MPQLECTKPFVPVNPGWLGLGNAASTQIYSQAEQLYVISNLSQRACERSSWMDTASPVGMWVMRTAESVVLTCCPPAPLARKVSMRRSLSLISKSTCVPIQVPLS